MMNVQQSSLSKILILRQRSGQQYTKRLLDCAHSPFSSLANSCQCRTNQLNCMPIFHRNTVQVTFFQRSNDQVMQRSTYWKRRIRDYTITGKIFLGFISFSWNLRLMSASFYEPNKDVPSPNNASINSKTQCTSDKCCVKPTHSLYIAFWRSKFVGFWTEQFLPSMNPHLFLTRGSRFSIHYAHFL